MIHGDIPSNNVKGTSDLLDAISVDLYGFQIHTVLMNFLHNYLIFFFGFIVNRCPLKKNEKVYKSNAKVDFVVLPWQVAASLKSRNRISGVKPYLCFMKVLLVVLTYSPRNYLIFLSPPFPCHRIIAGALCQHYESTTPGGLCFPFFSFQLNTSERNKEGRGSVRERPVGERGTPVGAVQRLEPGPCIVWSLCIIM